MQQACLPELIVDYILGSLAANSISFTAKNAFTVVLECLDALRGAHVAFLSQQAVSRATPASIKALAEAFQVSGSIL